MTKLFKPHLNQATILLKAMPVVIYIIFLLIFQTKLTTYLLFMTTLPLPVPCIFVLYSFVKTDYLISQDGYLFVQHGFAKKKLNISNINSITSIKKVSFGQWFRTYALSTKGLSISHGANDEIIVSPKEKESFISTLQYINAAIVLK